MTTFLISSLFTIIYFVSVVTARDIVLPSESLADDAVLLSADGTFTLGFFTPENSTNRYVGVWYSNVGDRRIVWVANRDNPVVNSSGILSVTTNGTMAITNRNSNEVVWSFTPTTAITAPFAQVLDTGNFVLKGDGKDKKKCVWQGFEHPTDTLLAGMKFGLYWDTGVTVNLTSWKSKNDPSKGQYYAVMDTNTIVYIYSGSRRVWRSVPWDAMNLRSSGLDYKYVNDSQESTFMFKAGEKPMILTFSSKGTVQLYVDG